MQPTHNNSPRQNWLEDNHIIGQLLKPHTRNTIFINFAARNTLVAEEGSGVQSMFSVFSVFPNIFPLNSEGTSAFWHSFILSALQIKSSGGEGWSNAADSRGDVEQILVAGRSLPEDDGGERLSSKPVGWTERFPLQVNRRMPPFQ